MQTQLLASTTAFALLLLLCWRQSIPPDFNRQGKLTEPQGNPVPTGDYLLTFLIAVAAEDGRNPLQPHIFDSAIAPSYDNKIPVVQGYFNVMLCPVDDRCLSIAAAFNRASRLVAAAIGSNIPTARRKQIPGASFSFSN